MVFPATHSLVSFIGEGWSGAEIWAFTMRVANGGVAASETQMDALAAAATAYFADAAVDVSSEVSMTQIKCAPIGTDGKYPAGRDAVDRFLVPPIVSAKTVVTAPQIAMCVSLTTDKPRGLAYAGRYYLPAYSADGVGAAGTISTNDALALAVASSTFVEAVGDALASGVVVMSSVGAGHSEPVTGTRVGIVLDTQRRRRNALEEDYQAAPLPS